MDVSRFKSLGPELQALIATAVVFDGQDALTYLATDAEHGEMLVAIAAAVTQLEADLRVQLMGTLLRDAVSILSQGKLT